MKHNLVALSLLGLFLCFGVNAANEPVAGAVLKSDTTVTPKADFNPANLTDIAPTLSGKKEEENPDIYFSADELETDENESLITASGNVVVTRGTLELTSDKLWYNQKKDIIVAEGNVVLVEADGSVLYTDKITLSEKMNRAEVNKVKVLLRDESHIWAEKFVKKPNDNKQMKKASYTASAYKEDGDYTKVNAQSMYEDLF